MQQAQERLIMANLTARRPIFASIPQRDPNKALQGLACAANVLERMKGRQKGPTGTDLALMPSHVVTVRQSVVGPMRPRPGFIDLGHEVRNMPVCHIDGCGTSMVIWFNRKASNSKPRYKDHRTAKGRLTSFERHATKHILKLMGG